VRGCYVFRRHEGYFWEEESRKVIRHPDAPKVVEGFSFLEVAWAEQEREVGALL